MFSLGFILSSLLQGDSVVHTIGQVGHGVHKLGDIVSDDIVFFAKTKKTA